MEIDATDANAKDARKSTLNDPRLVYSPREDATSEGESAVLAVVYRFILDCHERKKGWEAESGREGAQSSSSQTRYPGARCDE